MSTIIYSIANLKAFIEATPATFAVPVALGSHNQVAALLNAPNAGVIPLTLREKNEFLTLTAAAAVRLAVGVGADGKTPLAQSVIQKWTAGLQHSYAADPGSQINLGVISLLGDPVADNLLTSAELTALSSRQGTLAEIQFGAGTVVSVDDVSAALAS